MQGLCGHMLLHQLTCQSCTWDVSKVQDKSSPRAKLPRSQAFHPRSLWVRSAWKCKPCHSVWSSLPSGSTSTSCYVQCLQGGSASSTSGAGWEQQSADKSGNSEQGNIKDLCPQECTPPQEGNYHAGSSTGSSVSAPLLHSAVWHPAFSWNPVFGCCACPGREAPEEMAGEPNCPICSTF